MRFDPKREEDFALQLTSMADLIFLLLIFFMITSSFVDTTRQLDLELPEAKGGVESKERKEILVEVGVEKRIRVNGDPVTLEDLEGRLKAEARKPGPHPLTIRADKRLDYGFVIQVMGASFSAGIRDISVAVKD
ncbi:MAG: biopolymer transporter ExbD [Nitrospinota bacterium]